MTLPDPERDAGMSTLVLGNLPPNQLKIMRFILQKGGEAVYTDLSQALAALPEAERLSQSEVDEALAGLAQQQWVIRSEAEPVTYRVNFRRKATRDLSEVIPQRGQTGETKRDIWNVLDTLGEQKDLSKKLDFKSSEQAAGEAPPAVKDPAPPPRRPEESGVAALVNRIFRLRPGEIGLVFALGFLLLSNSLARQVSGIVAVSGFLSEGGVNQILIVMGVDYCLVLVTAGVQTLIVDKFDRVSLMHALTFGFALVFTILRLMFTFHIPHWLNYSILYIVAEQQLITFPLVFWVLANDVFDMAQTKRLFPLIASWGFVGKILGTGFAAVSPDLFSRLGILSEEVLTVNVLIYLIAYLLILLGLRNVKVRRSVQQPETVRETLTEGWGFVKEVASFRYLVLAIIALAVCDTIIEFRFFVVTDAVFSGAAEYQRFYSLYRLCAVLAGFLMQTFLTSRLIDKMNLKNIFLIFPIVVITGSLGMIALPGIMTAVGAMFIVKLTRETVDESGRKSFQALVPEERRGRVSTFMDSYLPAVGTLLGCLVAGVIVLIGLKLQTSSYFFVYLAVVVVGGMVALWATLKMRTVYDSSMFNWRLKRRQRGGSVLDKLEF